MSDAGSPDIGMLLGLVVHDLRNPGATIGANVAYVKEVLPPGSDSDVMEALGDVETALGDLMLGLEQVAWIGRWLQDRVAMPPTDGDVVATIEALSSAALELELARDLPPGPLMARGGGASLDALLRVLLVNSAQHARSGQVRISARSMDGGALVELRDRGRAVAAELRETAFTLPGQQQIKGRADGRYGRVAGLFAVKVLAEGIGAIVEADEAEGAALFRIRLAAPAA